MTSATVGSSHKNAARGRGGVDAAVARITARHLPGDAGGAEALAAGFLEKYPEMELKAPCPVEGFADEVWRAFRLQAIAEISNRYRLVLYRG